MRSRTPLVIGVVVAVVAIVAAAAILLTRGSDDDSEEVDVAPPLVGQDYEGNAVEVVPGTDGPLMLVFLAHWCPHCNEEIPVLQQWEAEGGVPDGLQIVGVSTAVAADRPNYPPGEWLVEKGWEWPVLADDGELTAANAYGLTAFPFLTFIDADGNVTARASGELPITELQALADATVAA